MHQTMACASSSPIKRALVGLEVDSIAPPLAHRHNQHQHLAITHLVDEAKSSSAKFDFVAMTGSPQFAGWNPLFEQPFGQLVLELLLDPCAQGLPFPQGLGMKGQLIGHAAQLQVVHEIHQLLVGLGWNAVEGRFIAVEHRDRHPLTGLGSGQCTAQARIDQRRSSQAVKRPSSEKPCEKVVPSAASGCHPQSTSGVLPTSDKRDDRLRSNKFQA